jgi:hypothetical protein
MLNKVKCKKSHKTMSKTNEAQTRIKINCLLGLERFQIGI